MSRWFRFYGDALNDPKVQSLPGDLFKTWINLLCVASKHDGKLPVIGELTYLLRRRSDHLQRDLNNLVERGLLDLIDDRLEPHNWSERQYKSDTSAQRVQRYRERKSNVTVAVTETAPDNRVQNTESEVEKGSTSPPATTAPDPIPAINSYNELAVRVGLPRADRITPARRKSVSARLRECGGIDGWQTALAKIEASDFLTGRIARTNGHENWTPNLDWFLKPSNFTKLMEGSYDNKPGSRKAKSEFGQALDELREFAFRGDP